jgi:hypothetical protein
MMTQLELAPFTPPELNYIKEYCKVIEPVAISLDLLQGKAQAYFGTLLPTIVVTKQNLQDMISTWCAHTLQRLCKSPAGRPLN